MLATFFPSTLCMDYPAYMTCSPSHLARVEIGFRIIWSKFAPYLPYEGYVYLLSINVSNIVQGSSCPQKASQLVWYRWKMMCDCFSKPITLGLPDGFGLGTLPPYYTLISCVCWSVLKCFTVLLSWCGLFFFSPCWWVTTLASLLTWANY